MVDDAYPVHGMVVLSRFYPGFDSGGDAVMFKHDYTLDGLDGMEGFLAAGPTEPYNANGHNVIRNLIVIQDGVISTYCVSVEGGSNQYDIEQKYLDAIGCTCKDMSLILTSLTDLDC